MISAELRIADRTLVVYASDNGRGPGRTAAQPIRGSKLSTWEGGIRVPCIAWGPGLGVKSGRVSSEVVSAMDWYPTFATLAGLRVPTDRIIDGRDITPLLAGRTETVPSPAAGLSLNATVPLRRPWNPPGEWAQVVTRDEYLDAFFYHGSLGSLAAVRWDKWKLRLNPTIELYDLENDPGETKRVRNGKIIRKLRGMAIMFQEEMRLGARPAGQLPAAQ
jgi:arylsulfatase A-like enzyme